MSERRDPTASTRDATSASSADNRAREDACEAARLSREDIKVKFVEATRELKLRIEDMREAREREAARVADTEMLRRQNAEAERLVARLVSEVAALRGRLNVENAVDVGAARASVNEASTIPPGSSAMKSATETA